MLDTSLDALRAMHRRVSQRHAGPLELFCRTAVTRRVTRTETQWERVAGREQGIAIRLREHRGEMRLAATTEVSDEGILRAMLHALPAPLPVPWCREPGELVDLDAENTLPVWEHLIDWVAPCPVGSWVETGITVERWVSGERAGVRRRARGWARTGGRFQAARSWSALLDQPPDLRPEPNHPSSGHLVFLSPGAAARLVQLWVATLHGPDWVEGRPVGPGWRLTDEPRGKNALFGGNFDDAGFPTVSRTLADGRSVVGACDGAGSWRRGSYRDLPVARASHVVVETQDSAWGVPDVVTHETGPWVSSPVDFVRCCVGTWGEPEASHLGVVTPGLIFEF